MRKFNIKLETIFNIEMPECDCKIDKLCDGCSKLLNSMIRKAIDDEVLGWKLSYKLLPKESKNVITKKR